MPYTAEEKLQWEIEKLKAETRNLSRSFLFQPTFWIGVAGLAISLGANVFQWSKADLDKRIAIAETRELANTLRDQRATLAQVNEQIDAQKEALARVAKEIDTSGANGRSILKSVNDLQQTASTLGGIVETTFRELASAGSSQPGSGQPGSTRRRPAARETSKAAEHEVRAFEALVRKDFAAAQAAFQDSENAANGFHFSYEWVRLLRTSRDRLATPEGQKAVMDEALAKGYASYAPQDLQTQLRLSPR